MRCPLIALLLVACGWFGEPKERPERPRREHPEITAVGNGAPRTVVFVVVDTVRADHTSVCGYARPTTPVLAELVQRGAALSCKAYSPAPWTHPSHASFFTGKPVTEHGAMWVSESAVAINPVTRVRPLAADFDTLAEQFAAKGYQTAALVANMIVTEPSGLLQGFQNTVVTPSSLGLRGRKLKPAAKQLIDGLDPTRPLFLFVNLYDAHDPYPAIPAGTGWLPEQARVDLEPNAHDPDHDYVRYLRGTMPEAERGPFLTRLTDGYDWGVHTADENLGVVLAALERRGWLGSGFRVAITSDHGEMLGEHQLLRHGGFVWEGMTSVPLLVFDSTLPQQPTLPDPVSAVVVHDWLLHGQIPDVPVVAVAERNDQDLLLGTNAAALWVGSQKGVCVDGERGRYDLAADPGEATRLEVDAGLGGQLEPWCAGVERLKALPVPAADGGMEEALRAVGYVE